MLRNIIHRLQKWWKQMTCKHIWIFGSMRIPGKFTKYRKECPHCQKRVIRKIN